MPVVIGEAVVNPGDIIIGDDDGLLALPQDMAEETLKLAKIQEKKESDMLKAIRGGKKVDRRWVNETLRRLGCDIPKKMRS